MREGIIKFISKGREICDIKFIKKEKSKKMQQQGMVKLIFSLVLISQSFSEGAKLKKKDTLNIGQAFSVGLFVATDIFIPPVNYKNR